MEPNNERKTPAGEQNELFKKQVFSDETLRTADPEEEETGEQHFEKRTAISLIPFTTIPLFDFAM